MSNFLLRDPDCVLIHIPKTGGTSIRKGSWGKRKKGPRFGQIPDEWQDYFKFAFVREPLDRFLSAYRMFTKGTRNEPDWKLPADARPLTLAEFFDITRDDRFRFDQTKRRFEDRIRHHTIPQTHPFNCLRQADFIGRFEQIGADYALIAAHVGQTEPLPHMHSTAQSGRDPREELGPLADAVAEYYAEDSRFIAEELPAYRALG